MSSKSKIFTIIICILVAGLCAIGILLFTQADNKNNLIKESSQITADNLKSFNNEYQDVADKLKVVSYTNPEPLNDNEKWNDTQKEIEYIQKNYVDIYKTQQLNNNLIGMLTGKVNLSTTDYSIYRNSIESISDTIVTNAIVSSQIAQNKENKSNKVSNPTIISNEQYLSNLGLSNEFKKLFECIYPVGSIYISLNGSVPMIGSWQQLDVDTTLWNTADGGGEILEATLPNAKGEAGSTIGGYSVDGPFYTTTSSVLDLRSTTDYGIGQVYMDLHSANSIWQDGAIVRPPAISVTIFKRID